MFQVLYVASVVPSKIFLAFDLNDHCMNPVRMSDSIQPVILGRLDGFVPDIIIFKSVTAGANAAFNFPEL